MNAGWSWLQVAFPWQVLAMAVLIGALLVCRTLEHRQPASPARRGAARGVAVLLGACMASILLAAGYGVGVPMRQGFLVLNGSGQEVVLMLDGRARLRLPPRSQGRVARHGWRGATSVQLVAGSATCDLGRLEPGLYGVNASSDTWISGGVEGQVPVAEVIRNRAFLEGATPRLEGPGSRRLSERLSDTLVDFGGEVIDGGDGPVWGSVTFSTHWGWRSRPGALKALGLADPAWALALLILAGPGFLVLLLAIQVHRVTGPRP